MQTVFWRLHRSLTEGRKNLSFGGKLPCRMQHHGKPSITRGIRVRIIFHCCCPDVHCSPACQASSVLQRNTAANVVCVLKKLSCVIEKNNPKYLDIALISELNYLRHTCCIAGAGVNDKTRPGSFESVKWDDLRKNLQPSQKVWSVSLTLITNLIDNNLTV